MNCGIFEDSEENKLEYTPVYESYVSLMEQAIEGQVNQELALEEHQMDEFYAALQNREMLAQFQAINPETISALFNFIDFQKFKALMIEAKRMTTTEQMQD